MKIYKYLHSCLVFEEDGFKLLIDPGKFSFAEGLISPEDFRDVNAIIVTHNHPDHLDADILKSIVGLSGAPVHTNGQVSEEINKAGINSKILRDGENIIGPFILNAFEVEHEPLLDSPTPQMTALVLNGKVLHPVDSFEQKMQQYQDIELLLLPVMAPFTTEIAVADFADELQPKQILPVHDGYAKEFFLKQRYENYSKHFEKQGIRFHQPIKPGDFVELN
ncbi:MBL fold metallo-hydrolase [Mucilaginibacter ginkgonis]|uniref:MBL fold metallo-hydrolase n=1 Tax=Mucilaginibacter ginkgonis TaxID=2682091 RepID=A0A6I4I2B4_9SPHI|nr:MBL fold metallo-hydrolase [Mucilaginibacter ginkgonis]QQL49210.1 MBL fold metallo-hydrolase [Mucilaginibacter ginkgonis]